MIHDTPSCLVFFSPLQYIARSWTTKATAATTDTIDSFATQSKATCSEKKKQVLNNDAQWWGRISMNMDAGKSKSYVDSAFGAILSDTAV